MGINSISTSDIIFGEVAAAGAIGIALNPTRPVSGFGLNVTLAVITRAAREIFGEKVGFVFTVGMGCLLFKAQIDAERVRVKPKLVLAKTPCLTNTERFSNLAKRFSSQP
jgi:hypothetical protein